VEGLVLEKVRESRLFKSEDGVPSAWRITKKGETHYAKQNNLNVSLGRRSGVRLGVGGVAGGSVSRETPASSNTLRL